MWRQLRSVLKAYSQNLPTHGSTSETNHPPKQFHRCPFSPTQNRCCHRCFMLGGILNASIGPVYRRIIMLSCLSLQNNLLFSTGPWTLRGNPGVTLPDILTWARMDLLQVVDNRWNRYPSILKYFMQKGPICIWCTQE